MYSTLVVLYFILFGLFFFCADVIGYLLHSSRVHWHLLLPHCWHYLVLCFINFFMLFCVYPVCSDLLFDFDPIFNHPIQAIWFMTSLLFDAYSSDCNFIITDKISFILYSAKCHIFVKRINCISKSEQNSNFKIWLWFLFNETMF